MTKGCEYNGGTCARRACAAGVDCQAMKLVGDRRNGVEARVRNLLWDEHPECCGRPEVGASYGGQQEQVCCGCPEMALLNDAQIVSSLRAMFPESGTPPQPAADPDMVQSFRRTGLTATEAVAAARGLACLQSTQQPAVEPLRDELQRQCVEWNAYWRAPDAHGVELTVEQATELLRRALGVEVEVKSPAERLLREALPHAEWQDKRIHPCEGEVFQNWKLTVYLPVLESEPNKSPDAALRRALKEL